VNTNFSPFWFWKIRTALTIMLQSSTIGGRFPAAFEQTVLPKESGFSAAFELEVRQNLQMPPQTFFDDWAPATRASAATEKRRENPNIFTIECESFTLQSVFSHSGFISLGCESKPSSLGITAYQAKELADAGLRHTHFPR